MTALLVPIVGSGSEADPFRSQLADLNVNHSAFIPTGAAGQPLNVMALCVVTDDDALAVPDWVQSVEIADEQINAVMDALDAGLYT